MNGDDGIGDNADISLNNSLWYFRASRWATSRLLPDHLMMAGYFSFEQVGFILPNNVFKALFGYLIIVLVDFKTVGIHSKKLKEKSLARKSFHQYNLQPFF